MKDLPEITEALKHWPWSKKAVGQGHIPILARMGINALTRAKILVEDMTDIGLQWPVRSIPAFGEVVLTHYEIPDSDFGKIDYEDVPEAAPLA